MKRVICKASIDLPNALVGLFKSMGRRITYKIPRKNKKEKKENTFPSFFNPQSINMIPH
uniref:Uncharacterized protein n=1 Tax=Rhizophora mucronata TaxID=61149 RepID=A0A2P2NXC2_RHIMU